MVDRRAAWVLPGELASVPEARRLLTATLVHLPEDAVQVVLLLTSELVTNAVRHGEGQVSLGVGWDASALQVEVGDHSPGLPVMAVLDPEAVSGRGLVLVDSMAHSWGVVPDGDGKKVWFSLRL